MDMQSVISSDLSEVGYDADNNALVVEFKSGNTYQYSSVPQEVFDGLISAESVGKYFNQFIKGNYSYSKI